MDIFSLELRKLGLTEKEAKVYLAGLELGAVPVQKIAEETGITRPTAYEIIKKLKVKNLYIEISRGKKRLFLANSPEKILGILKTQRREIEEREREFIRIVSALEARYSKENGLKIYRGEEGLNVLKEFISFSSVSNILVVNRKMKTKYLENAFSEIKKRLGEINLREIKLESLKGTLIIFDKIIFLPLNAKEGYLIENSLIIDLFKSILIFNGEI